MRVIGAGLAVFLAVIAILLYQVSSGSGETAALSAIAPPEPTATVTLPPPSTATQQPTRVVPTSTVAVTSPTATSTTEPLAPTVVPVETAVIVEEPMIDDSELAEIDPVDEAPAVEYVEDLASEEADTHAAYLAGIGTSDAWSSAIETPNGGMIGTVLSGLANVRALPTFDAEVVHELHAGWPVAIYGATIGDFVSGSDLWYQVNGGYVSEALIGPYVPAAPDIYYAGHWVDVDLTNNIAVAYINDVPVNAVTIISGKAGFETPVGEHTIFARVESETLDSATVGIPEGDPEYYYLPDVPHTQYFATGGFAIHANYWSDPWQFGSSTSHGCVNMFAEDAAWFWWFLDIGSVVNVHY